MSDALSEARQLVRNREWTVHVNQFSSDTADVRDSESNEIIACELSHRDADNIARHGNKLLAEIGGLKATIATLKELKLNA